MDKITILIADDHKLVRQIWEFVLNNHGRFHVIAECASGEEAIEISREMRPNVVIMDINLPGISGVEATAQIRKFSPDSKIIAVSMHTQASYVKTIMKNGAMGYVTKNSPKEEIFKAILEVSSDRKYICEEIKNILSASLIDGENEQQGVNYLSQREIEIISFIKSGSSSKEIATELHLSVKTVEVHRYNILKKLNLKNAAALVNFISRHPEIR
ncbi:MAG TPA: response regulator transcription factor [Chitinophagaceae bacterium]|jgi:two-component system invasion response regulator UvrY